MPIYVYQNPHTEEYVEIFQGMNDEHEHTDKEGTKWTRVFLAPGANFDTQVDPYSHSDYMKATANKKGTIGDLMDYSKELSDKRTEKDGKDSIREKFFKETEKNTGHKHKADNKVYESKNVRVEYD